MSFFKMHSVGNLHEQDRQYFYDLWVEAHADYVRLNEEFLVYKAEVANQVATLAKDVEDLNQGVERLIRRNEALRASRKFLLDCKHEFDAESQALKETNIVLSTEVYKHFTRCVDLMRENAVLRVDLEDAEVRLHNAEAAIVDLVNSEC